MGCRQSLGDREADFRLIDSVLCVLCFWVLYRVLVYENVCIHCGILGRDTHLKRLKAISMGILLVMRID